MIDKEDHKITGDRVVLELAVTLYNFITQLPDEARAWFAKELECPSLDEIAPRGSQWLRNVIDGDNPGPVDLSRWSSADIAQASVASCALFQQWATCRAAEPHQLAFLLVCMFGREAGLRLQKRHSATYN